MNEKFKTWTLRFAAKENPNMERALFDWPIVLQYDVEAKYRLIDWILESSVGLRFLHPSVRLTNQIALFPFVCCFCFVRAFFISVIRIALISEALFNCVFVPFRCTLNFTVLRNKIQKYLTKFTSECAIWADLIFSPVTTKWRITVSQWPTSGISNLTALPSATKGSVEKRSKRGKILVSKARICKFQMEAFCSVPVTL